MSIIVKEGTPTEVRREILGTPGDECPGGGRWRLSWHWWSAW
jgi:hypothetical protein